MYNDCIKGIIHDITTSSYVGVKYYKGYDVEVFKKLLENGIIDEDKLDILAKTNFKYYQLIKKRNRNIRRWYNIKKN